MQSDVLNKKLGRLTVIEILPAVRPSYNKRCKAVCDCGKVKEFLLSKVKSGHTQSCGCLYKQPKSHGMCHTPLDNIFYSMKSRCYSVNKENYKYYGGRGIVICDEWLNDKSKFFQWALENGFQEGLTIDRINHNGNYEPKWAIEDAIKPPIRYRRGGIKTL
jgi:hypothetical protein